MNKKEKKEIEKIVLSECKKEYEKQFYIEMNKLKSLSEIQNHFPQNNWRSKSGDKLNNKLLRKVRVFFGKMFEMEYYLLIGEMKYLIRFKNKDLNRNDFLYGYLMEIKKSKKSILNNYLFYLDGENIRRIVFDNKLNYTLTSKYQLKYFGDNNCVDLEKYKLLEEISYKIYEIGDNFKWLIWNHFDKEIKRKGM